MSKVYTSQDNIVKVIQCYKLGLGSHQISVETCVKACTIRHFVAKFKMNGKYEIPEHKYGGGRVSKVFNRSLTLIEHEMEKIQPLQQGKSRKKKCQPFLGVTV